MPYKRILSVQDISCVGQCSMTVALPILSACGHETCILPAAILSTHTGGFGKPAVHGLGDFMDRAVSHWQEIGITFDLIYVGYLGSVAAVKTAVHVVDTMLAPGGITVVDPAMADHGKRYSGLSDEYESAMFELCEKADVMIPNLTEAYMMAGLPYREESTWENIHSLLEKLPGRNVLLTGVGFSPDQTGFALRSGDRVQFYHHPKIGKAYSGTGDIFASVFCGALASGKEMYDAATVAAQFVMKSVEITASCPAHWYGVKFEQLLPELAAMQSLTED